MRYQTDDLKQVIETFARGLCAEAYQRRHASRTEAQAWTYAERHWRKFVPVAIDVIALHEAQAEAEAAPQN